MTQIVNIRRPEKVQVFLDANPGLEEAFNVARSHNIVDSIYRNLTIYGRLSEKQISCILNIASGKQRIGNETFVNAPKMVGRTEVIGKVLAVKSQPLPFYGAGVSYKMLVAVATDGGNFKAWGTIPSSILHDLDNLIGGTAAIQDLRGKTVAFEAKFTVADNDPTMTFFSRPSNGIVINEEVK